MISSLIIIMGEDNETREISQFFDKIEMPSFHSIEEEEHFLELVYQINSNLDELVKMILNDQGTIENNRNKLIDALKTSFFNNPSHVAGNTPQGDFKPTTGQFNEVLTRWKVSLQ